MMAILQATFFWFFAIIGFCEIVRRIIFCFFEQKEKKEMYVILTVKNEEENIEDIVRSIVWKYSSQKNFEPLPHIIVVDLGSTDATFDILEKLTDEYPFLYPMTKDHYIEYLQDIMEKPVNPN